MNKNIKKIEYLHKYKQVIINDKYLIDYNKIATAYNLTSDKDIPSYIFKWMIDNHLIQK